MKLAIVIVTHNSSACITQCLSAIGAPQGTEIIIIDNASTDDTVVRVAQAFPKATIVHHENNGYAGGNNRGIEYALEKRADYILILNPDTSITKDAINTLLQKTKLFPHAILGPVLFSDSHKKTIWAAGGELDKNRYSSKLLYHGLIHNEINRETITTTFIPGACMLIPSSLLKTGLRFHPAYFMYYEEVEFCLVAQKKGYASICVTDVSAVHHEKSEQDGFKPHKEYYLARNHLLFVERNAPYQVQLRECLRVPKTIFEHMRDKNTNALKGIYDYFTRHFGKYKTQE